MLQLILFAAFVLLRVSEVQAQTVSIVRMDRSRGAIEREARRDSSKTPEWSAEWRVNKE
jgi:hypothetical protein